MRAERPILLRFLNVLTSLNDFIIKRIVFLFLVKYIASGTLKITASYWLRTFHYFCSEHHCRSSSSHRLSCYMKFNRPRCSHVCLLWYGSSRVSSSIGKNNRNSEWFFIINWEPLCGTVTNFRKKMKHHIFFQSDIWADIYVVFIRLSHFLSAKPIKPTVFNNSDFRMSSSILYTIRLKYRYKSCKQYPIYSFY